MVCSTRCLIVRKSCVLLFGYSVTVSKYLCVCVSSSAGTERHELTSWMSFESIFRFFTEALKAKEEEEAEENAKTVTTRSSSFRNKHQDL